MKNIKNVIVIMFIFHNFLFAYSNSKQLIDACENGNGKACMTLAEYYGSGSRFYNIEKNDAKAKQFYKKYYQLANSDNIEDLVKQCDYGLAGVCRYIAYCYRDGKKVMKNRHKEIQYYKKACKLGDIYICDKIPVIDNMSEYFSTTLHLTNNSEKYKRLEKICNGGYAKACNYLFQKYKSKGKEIEASKYFNKTKHLMEKDCKNNIGEGCQWMWNFYIYIKKRDEGKKYFNKAKALYKKECDTNSSSCLAYQLLLKNGY